MSTGSKKGLIVAQGEISIFVYCWRHQTRLSDIFLEYRDASADKTKDKMKSYKKLWPWMEHKVSLPEFMVKCSHSGDLEINDSL